MYYYEIILHVAILHEIFYLLRLRKALNTLRILNTPRLPDPVLSTKKTKNSIIAFHAKL